MSTKEQRKKEDQETWGLLSPEPGPLAFPSGCLSPRSSAFWCLHLPQACRLQKSRSSGKLWGWSCLPTRRSHNNIDGTHQLRSSPSSSPLCARLVSVLWPSSFMDLLLPPQHVALCLRDSEGQRDVWKQFILTFTGGLCIAEAVSPWQMRAEESCRIHLTIKRTAFYHILSAPLSN